MIIKDIARKYDIPYRIVYQATYGIQTVRTRYREREYPEKAVIQNLRAMLEDRITKHMNSVSELQVWIDKLDERAE